MCHLVHREKDFYAISTLKYEFVLKYNSPYDQKHQFWKAWGTYLQVKRKYNKSNRKTTIETHNYKSPISIKLNFDP